ncbi:MAG: hypothetical protein ABIG64_00345 [Candidatus Omnitrophota bacterium]
MNDHNIDQELKNIFSDFKSKKQAEAQEEIIEQKKSSAVNLKGRRISLIVGLMIITVLVFSLCGKLFSRSSPLRTPQPWARGERSEFDIKIDGCLLNLWRLRKALDLFYADQGKFPQEMDELVKGRYLNKELICPVSKKAYIFKERDDVRVYACPSPYEHNTEITEIYCNVINSPPVIVRLNDPQE